MNKKVKTITTWLAAAIFLLALAINIKVTLDDPFVMLSDEAIAQTTTSTGNTGTVDYSSNYIDDPQDCIVTETVECTVQLQIYTWCVNVGWNYTFEWAHVLKAGQNTILNAFCLLEIDLLSKEF